MKGNLKIEYLLVLALAIGGFLWHKKQNKKVVAINSDEEKSSQGGGGGGGGGGALSYGSLDTRYLPTLATPININLQDMVARKIPLTALESVGSAKDIEIKPTPSIITQAPPKETKGGGGADGVVVNAPSVAKPPMIPKTSFDGYHRQDISSKRKNKRKDAYDFDGEISTFMNEGF